MKIVIEISEWQQQAESRFVDENFLTVRASRSHKELKIHEHLTWNRVGKYEAFIAYTRTISLF